MILPTKEENPHGLHQKYILARVDGQDLDPEAEFFILRLDAKGKNHNHINACRRAVLAYADAIAPTKPGLALDLYARYNATIDHPPRAINPEPHI